MSEKVLGRTSWPRPATEYEKFCEAEGVPIHRDLIGVDDVRSLPLGDWARLGGRGAFIDLDGTGGYLGLYLLEIPGAKALEPEHHLFEEVFLVLDGRGSTEVWVDGANERQHRFEWGTDSVFSVPMNAHHRLVNAALEPALLLVATNAPPVMALFEDREFVFGTSHHFAKRFQPADADYFAPTDSLGTDEVTHRALHTGAVIPNAARSVLPYDGQRGSGHRRYGLKLAGNVFRGHIAEYPSGRYSKTHAHESGPVLVCLAGSGYTLTWPTSAGTTPWRDGKSELVRRQDYRPGGIVSAAPGGSNFFHGHFGTSRQPMRVMAFLGGFPPKVTGAPGSVVVGINQDIRQGGQTIEYRDEDPRVREIFKEALSANGATFDMPDEVYR
jgi:mannose-6-phosphate isomerase-like protein (cupin superfamily)